ncbi:MAG: hypothetical protein AAGA91_10590 [Pseudomonadota bacterium]
MKRHVPAQTRHLFVVICACLAIAGCGSGNEDRFVQIGSGSQNSAVGGAELPGEEISQQPDLDDVPLTGTRPEVEQPQDGEPSPVAGTPVTPPSISPDPVEVGGPVDDRLLLGPGDPRVPDTTPVLEAPDEFVAPAEPAEPIGSPGLSQGDETTLPDVPTNPDALRGIVYTRQPRASLPVPGTALEDASNWQHVSDVGRINGGIAESDVVIDDLAGNVRVIHDCTTSADICVAQEARVSPDGGRIAYSVGYGNQLTEVRINGVAMGIYDIPALTHAQLFIYDLQTQSRTAIPNHGPGVIDRQPEWLDNDTLAFSSNRANVYPHKTQFSQHRGTYADGSPRWFGAAYGVSQPYGYRNAGKSMQIWAMDIDGSNARNLSPHETMALSPMVMTNGDILYSCWNGHGNEAFDSAFRHTNGPGTEVNKWWLCQMDGNGAGGHVVLGAHKSPLLRTRDWLPAGFTGGEGASELRALRSAAEIRRGYIAITNYYRSNHTGSMGIVYGMSYKGPGVEGVSRLNNYQYRVYSSDREGSGRYIPSDFVALTPYGNDQDIAPRRDPLGRVVGKAGYASALPGTDTFMLTHARGVCYEAAPFDWGNRAWTGGEPLCQKGIYRAKVAQVTNPFDTDQLEPMAGGDDWQAYDADAITTFAALWGQDLPAQAVPLTGDRCFLQVVDARAAELQAPNGYDWRRHLYEQCSSQGCAVNSENRDFHANNMHYLTVLEVGLWDISYADGNQAEFGRTTNNHGFKRVGVWGYQAIESDGSARMEVPCETPLQIIGQDIDTMSIAHDDKLHSLRRGETRTCHGCHDGHSEERAAELGQSPEARFAGTLASVTTRSKPANGYRVTWSDVAPILIDRCSGCHTDMLDSDGLLQSRVAWDFEQLDWPWMDRQPAGNGSFRLPRPYTSKWVAKFARDSLLYWKCMGARQDGRTDRQYADDIDFGSAHPAADPEDCAVIGHWIDQGIQKDP